jgi:hypothetical protein
MGAIWIEGVNRRACGGLAFAALVSMPQVAMADEGGVSFWAPRPIRESRGCSTAAAGMGVGIDLLSHHRVRGQRRCAGARA